MGHSSLNKEHSPIASWKLLQGVRNESLVHNYTAVAKTTIIIHCYLQTCVAYGPITIKYQTHLLQLEERKIHKTSSAVETQEP